ncbi:MAG: hypothetical protein ABIH38_04570 [Patescibacteria group bacterium]
MEEKAFLLQRDGYFVGGCPKPLKVVMAENRAEALEIIQKEGFKVFSSSDFESIITPDGNNRCTLTEIAVVRAEAVAAH